MLQAAYIAQNRDAVVAGLQKKNFKETDKVDQIISLDEKRRKVKFELDELLGQQNAIAKEIGQLFAQGKRDEADALKAKAPVLKEQSKELQEQLDALELDQYELLVTLPNLPHSSVPAGKTPEENEVVKQVGTIPTMDSTAKPHWELLEQFGIVDLALGTKITGAGFPVYLGKGARLQRALINFFLDEAIAADYKEVNPPLLVNNDTAFGTGQLPDKEGQMYYATADDYYLIPTAEVPVTNIHRDDILAEGDLPIRYCAYSPCFRREAGSYGKDVRGLNRVHQFEKVEIVQFQTPEKSYETLEGMVSHVERILQKLELPYRILRLCGGDMSFASALTYDFEVYSAAQQRWLEVSSVSNFETFQSNRMKIRYKGNEDKKTQLVHTLNGSALALPRIVAALLENNQTAEGTVRLPKVLHSYTGFEVIG